jgi:hypothetical protein
MTVKNKTSIQQQLHNMAESSFSKESKIGISFQNKLIINQVNPHR